MRLLLDLLQAAGVGTATGLRPFLPTLVTALLARADLGVDFEGTAFAFLESPVFIAAVAVALVVAVLVGRRTTPGGRFDDGLIVLGVVLGALLGAGSVDDHAQVWWPGLILGALGALLAGVATRQLLARTRARLDAEAGAALPAYAEAVGLVIAAICVLVEPAAIIAVAFFAWLLVGGRRRQGEKYAGLRILR